MASVLVIDDDELFRDMLTKMVEREGFQVIGAENGVQAEKILKAEAVDLVITDIVMPEKEGIETIRYIKKNIPDLPVIAISGGVRIKPEFYLDVAAKLGVDYTFQKPFDRKELMKAVRQCLDSNDCVNN